MSACRRHDGPPRLLADEHLQRLARYLRAAGLDVACAPGAHDDELLRRARAEDRLLLTRDRELARRAGPQRALLLRSMDLEVQLVRVLGELGVDPEAAALSRCLRCNEPLAQLRDPPARVPLPPAVRARGTELLRCPRCQRIFWEGSHTERLTAALRRAKRALHSGPRPERPAAPEG